MVGGGGTSTYRTGGIDGKEKYSGLVLDLSRSINVFIYKDVFFFICVCLHDK